ncbi:hypothetical protein Tco_0593267 [Tanacetum coccineum]
MGLSEVGRLWSFRSGSTVSFDTSVLNSPPSEVELRRSHHIETPLLICSQNLFLSSPEVDELVSWVLINGVDTLGLVVELGVVDLTLVVAIPTKTGWSDLGGGLCHRCADGKPGISLVKNLFAAAYGDVFLDVTWYLLRSSSRTIRYELAKSAGKHNFAQPAFTGAGAGMEMSACREVEALTISFQFCNIGRYHRRSEALRTHFRNHGFASGVTTLDLPSMMLEQSAGFCPKMLQLRRSSKSLVHYNLTRCKMYSSW